MIKTVVFDLGKVLVDFDYRIAARNLAARSRLTAEQIIEFVSRDPALLRYERGLLTNEEFYQAIRAAAGFAGDFTEFAGLFGNIFSAIDPMVQLHAALRERGLPTYIFSNTNDFAVRHIRGHFPFFSRFDGYILSYEHRALKPEPELYQVVERQTGQRGSAVLYLDDRPENVEAGAARGWQVLLHQTPEKTRAAVQALGLLPACPLT